MDQANNAEIKTEKIAPPPKKRNFWVIIIIVLAFYFGVAWGKTTAQKQQNGSNEVSGFIDKLADPTEIFGDLNKNKPEDLNFDIFWEAWRELDKKYVDTDKIDPQEMVYGAIRGMVKSLGDPYSGFMDPEETADFNTDMEGSFEGIGAELGMKEGVLTVIAPIEGMPAQAAGIRSGDKIIQIDGEITADISIDEAVKRIRGKKGTQVALTILRDGEDMTRDITITRDRIEIKSVIYEQKDDGVAYIKIKKFAEDTTNEFEKAVTMAIVDNSRGVVLDVRNNPGGFLSIAVDIISKFVPRGEVVVWEQGRDGKRESYQSRGGNSLNDLPVVVLVNEGSASASEIVAGALRDLRGTLLVGKKSFGKGSVQQLETLRDNSSLRITIAKWLTPSGKSIHEVGLDPDIEVEITNDDYDNERDPQLDRALEEIRNQIQSR